MENDLIIIIENPQETMLTLEELCAACHVNQKTIIALVSNDVVTPMGKSPDEWKFTLSQLKRIRTALRLAHDLELDYAAVAVVLDLIERIDKMRAQLTLLEKHFLQR